MVTRARAWLAARKAAVRLVLLIVILSGANLLWTAYEVRSVGQDFCGVISGFTAVKVHRPADPAANPSRETSWEWYERFVSLGQRLGC